MKQETTLTRNVTDTSNIKWFVSDRQSPRQFAYREANV